MASTTSEHTTPERTASEYIPSEYTKSVYATSEPSSEHTTPGHSSERTPSERTPSEPTPSEHTTLRGETPTDGWDPETPRGVRARSPGEKDRNCHGYEKANLWESNDGILERREWLNGRTYSWR